MKPIIPNEEFKQRVLNTQKKMREKGLDLLLCYGNEAEPQFVRYYSDYWPSFESAAVLIPADGEPFLLIGPESLTYATSRSRIAKIRKVLALRESSEPDYPGVSLKTFDDVIMEVTNGKAVKNIGIAGINLITHTIYTVLEDALKKLGHIEIVKADNLVSELRAIKSENEIACLKEAYRIAQKAMKAVFDGIHVGMTENQVKAIAIKVVHDENAEGEAYCSWVATGKGSNQAISRLRGHEIKKGDMVQVGLSARYEGYASTMGRPVVMGKANDEQIKMINAALTVQKAILSTAKEGVPAKKISEVHYETLKNLGCDKYILYGPCHGTGLMEGEYPWIESNSTYDLKKGMTFCTCLYLGDDENEVGIRVEDGFMITKNGTESFSDYRRELIEIDR